MAGNTIPQLPKISSPKSELTATSHAELFRSARKEAAAKALAEQSRLSVRVSQQLTSLSGNPMKPLEYEMKPHLQGSQEKRQNITPTKYPSSSKCTFSPLSVEPTATPIWSSTRPLHSSLCQPKHEGFHPTTSAASVDGHVLYDNIKVPADNVYYNFPRKSSAVEHGQSMLLQGEDTTKTFIALDCQGPLVTNTELVVSISSGIMVAPRKFSPKNFAKRDVRFEVQLLSMKGQTIKSGDLKHSASLFLEWNGKSGDALKIVINKQEHLSVEFDTIQRVSYNPSGQHLQLIFKTATDEQQTVIIAMKDLSSENWSELQQLFRQVEKKWKIKCDQESMTFFQAAIKSMTKKPYKKMETPYLDRSDTASRNAGTVLDKLIRQRPTRSKLSTCSAKRTEVTRSSKRFSKKEMKGGENKRQFGPQVRNILAAKLIEKPYQIPHLTTPSRAPSVTESLLSRMTQSPLSEEPKSHRASLSKDVSDHDSQLQGRKRIGRRQLLSKVRDTGSPVQRQGSAMSPNSKSPTSPRGTYSLFGSDDSEHDSLSSRQSAKTPSQRFKDLMNEAKTSFSKATSSWTSIGFDPPQSNGCQTGVSLKVDSSFSDQTSRSRQSAITTVRRSEKPEHGFQEFLGKFLTDNVVQEDSDSESALFASFPSSIKREIDISPPKVPVLLPQTAPTMRVAKRSRSSDGDIGSSKKFNEIDAR